MTGPCVNECPSRKAVVSFSDDIATQEFQIVENELRPSLYYTRSEIRQFKADERLRIERRMARMVMAMALFAKGTQQAEENQPKGTEDGGTSSDEVAITPIVDASTTVSTKHFQSQTIVV
jgi:hypothetical protein